MIIKILLGIFVIAIIYIFYAILKNVHPYDF